MHYLLVSSQRTCVFSRESLLGLTGAEVPSVVGQLTALHPRGWAAWQEDVEEKHRPTLRSAEAERDWEEPELECKPKGTLQWSPSSSHTHPPTSPPAQSSFQIPHPLGELAHRSGDGS